MNYGFISLAPVVPIWLEHALWVHGIKMLKAPKCPTANGNVFRLPGKI